jgi:phosphoribosylformimino-5-aminoimidazole carboxamide ribotide isomerase
MLIIPAIDIRNGKCVRLYQGDYARETVYNEDPVAQAKIWEQKGARLIHLVDLDAARDGKSGNRKIIEKIISGVHAAVEVGGGIRTIEDARALIDAGVKRVIVGTKAVERPQFIKELIADFGVDSVSAGIDSRNRLISFHGWTDETEYRDVEFLDFLHMRTGVEHVIYTDIMKDGTLEGPNIQALDEIISVSDRVKIICSGGIGKPEDIQKLAEMNRSNLEGVIVGKAVYDGRVDLASVIEQYQSEEWDEE